MSGDQATLLLVTVGSAVGTGILDSLDLDPALRQRLRLVGLHPVADAANNFRCERCYLVPGEAASDAYRARLAAIIAAERPRLVLACRDDVLEPLARIAASVDPAETTILVSSAAVAAIANDKYATHRFAQRHGLPFADTAIDRAGLDRIEREHGYPMIAKPRGGHGSLGVSIVRQRVEAEAALGLDGLCLQPYIGAPDDLDRYLPDLRHGPPLAFSLPGADLSAAIAVVDRAGDIIAFNCWQSPVMVVGEPRRVELDPDPALAMVARAFVAALIGEGLLGPCAFQFRRDRQGRPICFEVNARLGGVEAARTQLGAPLVAHLIRHFAFGPLPPLGMPAGRGGIVLRALADRVVDRADVARLTDDGVWIGGNG